MKILQVASGDFFSTYGGGQVYVKNLIDDFINLSSFKAIGESMSKEKHHELTVLSFVYNLKEPKKKNYKGIDLWEVSNNPSKDILYNLIKEIKPDIIHAHSLKHLICRIGENLNIPVIVTAHHGGIYCPGGTSLDCKDRICERKVKHKDCLPCILRNTRTGLKLWYPFMKYLPQKTYIKIGKYLTKKPFIPFITPIGLAAKHIQDKIDQWNEIKEKCTLMIAPSNKIAETMIINELSKGKVKVIPHGIPLPKEKPSFPEIKEGKIKFFYVGRICYVKGIHVMLESFSNISNKNIELHIIGGAGNKVEKRYLSCLQKKYKKDSRIIWHGKVSNAAINEKIKDFHIAISPSIFLETFGLNIAEALALGKPVLTTQNGGGEMQIKDGTNGWIIEANNVIRLKEKIEDIISKPLEIKKMSLNCKTQSIQNHLQSLTDIYYKILN